MISFFITIFLKRITIKMTLLSKLLFEFVNIGLTLGLIYFASESFNFKNLEAETNSISLLMFLLIGEIALVIPMSFAEKFLTNFIEIKNSQFYQTLLGLRISPIHFVLSKSFIDSIFPILRVGISLILGVILFKLNIYYAHFFIFVFLQILSVLIFAFMALISALIYLRFNRGIGLFYSLQSFAVILGGAYFPTNVFPNPLRNFSTLLPQTQIIQSSRELFQGVTPRSTSLIILSTWLVFFALFWLLFNTYTISWLKRKARFF